MILDPLLNASRQLEIETWASWSNRLATSTLYIFHLDQWFPNFQPHAPDQAPAPFGPPGLETWQKGNGSSINSHCSPTAKFMDLQRSIQVESSLWTGGMAQRLQTYNFMYWRRNNGSQLVMDSIHSKVLKIKGKTFFNLLDNYIPKTC